VLLRRLIHQLEKGLMHTPRRPLFALDYINQTVDLLINLSKGKSSQTTLLDWATDVLENYFDAVDSHPVIDKAKKKFENRNFVKRNSPSQVPYKISDSNQTPVTFDDVVRGRKSVRWFEEGRIPPRTLIDEAIELASLAPSS